MGLVMLDGTAPDVPSFESLVATHLPRLRKRAARMCRGRRDADDIVQDALVRAFQRRASLRSPERAGGWLLTIVSHTFIDQLRYRQARPLEVALASEPLADDDVDAPAWTRLSVDDVAAAVAELPDDVRETFRRFALEGQDYATIAADQGIPKGTVGARIHRARARLRTILLARLAE
jgi:RNA polymerase sigma-70 factor (ECF subfamily)